MPGMLDRCSSEGAGQSPDGKPKAFASLCRGLAALPKSPYLPNPQSRLPACLCRDLKPENFLLTSAESEGELKLTDFGLSVFFKPGERFRDLVGSPYYVAPEVLRKDYSHEADMWSLGVILYILLSGLPPFWGDNEEQIFKMVLKG